jgi:3-deoxy-manno-octulosonate cytidylyltransferase (CMP-KDO synthetase)
MADYAAARVVAIIPSRYASERLPAKPLADIHGKPMVQHVVERTSRAALVHRVIVATDDERIAAVVRGFGGEAWMTPVECASGSDRIARVARDLPEAEIVVNVQGDEPLIPPGMIDQTVQLLLDDPLLPVGTVVRAITDPADLLNPAVVKVVLDRQGHCLYFSRSPIPHVRGLAPEGWLGSSAFYKHFGVYVFRRAFLLSYASMAPSPLEQAERLEQLRILEHGHRIGAVITDHDSIPVDTPADLDRVRALMART